MGSFKFATWNIKENQNPGYGANYGDITNAIASIIDTYGFDLVCFQELCTNRFDDVAQNLRNRNWHGKVNPALIPGTAPNTWTYYAITVPSICGNGYGIGVVSRFPTKNPLEQTLSAASGDPDGSRKALRVEPLNLGTTVHVYCTHVWGGNQVSDVASFAASSPAGYKRIIANDFNSLPGYVRMDPLYAGYSEVNGGRQATPYTAWNDVSPYAATRIDYVFYGAGVTPSGTSIVGSRIPPDPPPPSWYTSDHRPIVTTITV